MHSQLNPLFNSNRMKLGIFGTNGKGAAQTLVPEAYRPTWRGSVRTAELADQAGFEAIVAYARWKGYIPAKPKHPSGVSLDPFTWAAGIAQATSHTAVFATTHAPTMHPLLAAKQCATIDIISGGRFGLNIVGGWNRPELEMFGAPLNAHDVRYEHLAEWLHVVERLWSEDEEFDFHGKFFTINCGSSEPKPVQRPRPVIMNAGSSGRGMEFACQHADLCFVVLQDEDSRDIAKRVHAYRSMARERFGRDVAVWTYAAVVQRQSRSDAEDYVNHYAVKYQDIESVDAWSAGIVKESRGFTEERVKAMRLRFAAGGGGTMLVGRPEDIVDRITVLSDAGIDGVLLTWVDFEDGIARFAEDALPLLEKRGLRQPYQHQP